MLSSMNWRFTVYTDPAYPLTECLRYIFTF